ncbi:MAG: WHG domain-containing protein [Phenylobacterium sp.]|uniref:TetR/AcrR family transcriptional regulator n=1 Tax=Phenylobacterium sp. TaxID=1871053 RepID=UPI001A534D58|nr:TetR/AcrR family transcriptional regulator [Phenylobacterium sp.]MBL8773533.1 WHG domain-containing protein [Phenylobacterium sp.]
MEAGRKYHVGEVKSRLLREARGMLEEGQPLHLRALAARAGITAGSMYHHYENKTELLGELAAGGFRELRRDLEAAERAAVDGQRLRAWATGYFRYARAEPALFALMFDPEVAELEPVAEARAAMLASLHALVADVAAALDRPGAPLDKITLAVWAASHGAASLSPAARAQSDLIDDVIAGLDALFRPERG